MIKNKIRKNKFKRLKISRSFIFIVLILLTLLVVSTLYYIITSSKNNQSININEVPYISTYYINPIISTKEDVIIDFYITDFNHDGYIKEDLSNNFTVTIRAEDKKTIKVKNLKSGDNSINLGKFKTEGEKSFSIICTDEYNRNSHELFNYFLVRDNLDHNEYAMKEEDLNKYNISNKANEDNATSTREGL